MSSFILWRNQWGWRKGRKEIGHKLSACRPAGPSGLGPTLRGWNSQSPTDRLLLAANKFYF